MVGLQRKSKIETRQRWPGIGVVPAIQLRLSLRHCRRNTLASTFWNVTWTLLAMLRPCTQSRPCQYQTSTFRSSLILEQRPTFIFLKGDKKVDQVRGADRKWVLVDYNCLSRQLKWDCSGLENTLKKHASSSTGTFSGAGQTLGGQAAPRDVAKDVQGGVNNARARVTNLDPQLKIFLGLIAAYLVFWYLSSW